MTRKSMVEIISLLFIILFVYAAINKLLDIQKFQVQIGQSPLLTSISRPVSWFIPTFELAVAVALAMPRIRLMGLYLSFALMITFTAYIIAILNFSDRIPCSCGGVLETLGWAEHLAFNIAFVLLGLVGIVLSSNGTANNDSVAIPAEQNLERRAQ